MSKDFENESLVEELQADNTTADEPAADNTKNGKRKNIKRRPNKKMSKKGVAAMIIGIGTLVGFTVYGGIETYRQVKDTMKTVSNNNDNEDLFTVERMDVEQEISTSGTTMGLEENAYTSPVTAKVNDIRVEVGQTIHKGEVLLTYDADDLGDNLAKVKIQAQSERAASNESFEAANKAAGKADTAESKAKKLEKEIKALKKDVEGINDEIVKKQDELTDAQTKNAKIEASNEAAKAEIKEKNAAKIAAAVEGGVDPSTVTTEVAKQETTIDTKPVTGEIRELNKKLNKKTEKLTEAQTKLAEQKSIVSANKEVSVSDSTKAQISAARQLSEMNINDAQEKYDDGLAGITAETDGIISSIQITKGAYANETQTLITMIDNDKLGVSFNIAKENLGSVAVNQKARIVIGNNQYEGYVGSISRLAGSSEYRTTETTSGGSIQGKIVITNPDENLYVGVSAKVYIFVGKSEDTLAIPYEALNTDVKGDYVYVVDKDNIIQRKDVKIGIFSDEYYEITEGLEEGDKVIREVTKKMKPGDTYEAPAPQTPAIPGM